MNFKRTRLIVLAAFAFTFAFASIASASVTTGPYGGTTDTRPGGHGTLTTGFTFKYSDTSQSVKKILIDTPAGGVGNPNAVPYADRCTKAQFEKSTCSSKSQIGVATISATAYALGFLPIAMNDMVGTISEIQTTPEVPTLVGAYIVPPIGDPIRAYARFYPVTSGPDGDFRIRTETDVLPKTAVALGLTQPIQITKYEQKLFGKLANGNFFITNPTRCDTWMSGGYSEFWSPMSGADSDPFQTGTKTYFKSKPVPTEPDCKTLAPFSMSADASVNAPVRGQHADYSTTLKINGIDGDPQGAAVPKSVVVTLPPALTIDVAQLGRVCSNEDFAAASCPASTQVGTANIATPMIVEGLQGNVYLVKASEGHNLPDLGIEVTGAINFTLRGTNRFVNVSQIQTTFDNLPQVGFSTFSLNIAGAANGLLLVRRCPTDGSNPNDGGSTSFDATSYQGQNQVITSATSYAPPSCTSYTVSVKSVKQCVKKRSLKLRPSIRSRSEVKYVKYYLGKKQLKKVSRSPFAAKLKLSKKLKAGKSYRIKIKVYYKPSSTQPNGRVVTKWAKFKLCK